MFKTDVAYLTCSECFNVDITLYDQIIVNAILDLLYSWFFVQYGCIKALVLTIFPNKIYDAYYCDDKKKNY